MGKTQSKEIVRDLKLEVKPVKDCSESGLVGGSMTHLALKDHSSYLIGTVFRGLKLIENGAQVYSANLPEENNFFFDIYYVPPPLNYYLLIFKDQIFRKDINHKPPYLFMKLACCSRWGASLRYSKLLQRLIIRKDFNKISVINLKTRKLEIQCKKDIGQEIADFRLFGEKDNRVISVTRDGYILLYNLDFDKKRGVVGHYRIEVMSERTEEAISVALCEKSEYVFVELGNHDLETTYSCRFLVLKMSSNTFVKEAIIEQNQRPGQKTLFEPFRYVGNHILCVGLSKIHGAAQLFDYDVETKEFKEIEQKRVSHRESWPLKLCRFGHTFYYTGKRAKLMCLNVKIN